MIGFLDVLPGHSPSAILGATEAGATVRDGGVHGATWSTVLTELTSGDHLRIDRLEPAQVASARAKGVRVWARVGNQSQVRDAQAAGVDLWLTPLEAAGVHGELAATVLIRLAHESGRPWVIEGLGPLGMAAAVSVEAITTPVRGNTQVVALPQLSFPAQRFSLKINAMARVENK